MKIVAAIGTRPDVLKMLPVVLALREKGAEVEVWWSGQGRDMFPAEHQYLVTESSKIDWNKGLNHGITTSMVSFDRFLGKQDSMDAVLIHGDDATAYACGMAAFLKGFPIGHVEAGLRTYAREPFPEEAFRRMIGAMATWHFCPDKGASNHIMAENKGYMHDHSGIFVTGNTINDILPKKPFKVLATLHRRENWGKRILDALIVLQRFTAEGKGTIKTMAIRHPNWDAHLPTKNLVGAIMEEGDVIYSLEPPMDHNELIDVIQEADLVVTDSGGLQEEAAFLGTPCICVRTSTERTALVENGAVELVHPDRPEELRAALDRHLDRRYAYGRGDASTKIAEILMGELK